MALGVVHTSFHKDSIAAGLLKDSLGIFEVQIERYQIQC